MQSWLNQFVQVWLSSGDTTPEITKLIRLEKTFNAIKSNQWPALYVTQRASLPYPCSRMPFKHCYGTTNTSFLSKNLPCKMEPHLPFTMNQNVYLCCLLCLSTGTFLLSIGLFAACSNICLFLSWMMRTLSCLARGHSPNFAMHSGSCVCQNNHTNDCFAHKGKQGNSLRHARCSHRWHISHTIEYANFCY